MLITIKLFKFLLGMINVLIVILIGWFGQSGLVYILTTDATSYNVKSEMNIVEIVLYTINKYNMFIY